METTTGALWCPIRSSPPRAELTVITRAAPNAIAKTTAAATSTRIRVATTRTGVILSESGGALEKMLPFFKAGIGGPVAGGRQYVPWVHVDDVVGAIMFALVPWMKRLMGEVN